MKIKQIYRYLVHNNTIYYYLIENKHLLLAYDLISKERKSLDSGLIRDIIDVDENTFMCVTEIGTLYLSNDLKIIREYEFSDGNLAKHQNYIVYRKRDKSSERERTFYFLWDEENDITYQFDFEGFIASFIFHKDFIVPFNSIKKSSILRCFDYQGKKIWEWDVKELGTFYSAFDERMLDRAIKGVKRFENILIVSVYGFLLFAINIENGEIIWQQELHAERIVFDIDYGNKCIYIANMVLYKIDILTGEILLKKENLVNGQAFRKGLGQITVAEDGIYAATMYADPTKIMRYSKETLELLNVIDLDNNAIIPDVISPIVTDKYIIQLDGQDDLQIFKKDEILNWY